MSKSKIQLNRPWREMALFQRHGCVAAPAYDVSTLTKEAHHEAIKRQMPSGAGQKIPVGKPNQKIDGFLDVIGPCRLLLEARRKHAIEYIVGGLPPYVREEKLAAIRESRDFLILILEAADAHDVRS